MNIRKESKASKNEQERIVRARKLVRKLKSMYPNPKTELVYATPFQLVVAVILSAQCTDKKVNQCTKSLFSKYKTPQDFADADIEAFQKEIATITFFRSKAKYIINSAKTIVSEFDGTVPASVAELTTLSGVAYKTANVVLGELYNVWEGIATDTHVRRFALRFDLTDNTDLTKISKDLEALIPKKDWKYVNNGFVLYGRYICPAHEHDCIEHPLTKLWTPAANRWPKTK